ncbi:exodeoxyribonuclease III [Azospirillum sp. CT11-132]|uniref:exodeoxyribonuclease III n=1 Tax=unclassified Azospirillum TaxID=2630922 RepID=UPI000D621604|nr:MULTISPECIES: exodeoxyribonuclease III [unclassified Azospirillum]PWC66062.1 exodeoxyribonuclease III [Azospirillum sp. TSH7]PWC72457.1 exodeoxyribonuclease III [Azospirillum sp. TSH20]QCG96183.1 exodeoxyribonuclease III [Azospirillum sp. TSA2s]
MKIATWNVNSAKARLPLITDWLRTVSPDVVLFQEIKCETAAFPASAFEDLGYHVNAVGQKAYNGVALLSKAPAEDLLTRLPGEPEDEQARYVEATVSGVRIASLYLPNGNPVPGEKFAYKLRWMDRLYDHARTLLAQEIPVVLGGDYNIIPEARDVFSPQAFAGDALFRPESRAKFRALLNLGLTEAYRALHDDDRAYTFWDYQAGSWPRDNGLRIDHFLLSPQAADRLAGCTIDRGPRGLEKASDHTPVILDLRDA